jgi:1-acyl-sn-glycerol-3-phosphate acyltransferase
MRSRNPIAVTRTNPRHDLKVVLEQGRQRLDQGISIIIFPQTTRAPFNPEQFSTIATKLAGRAGVPLIPLALLTDAWGNGRLIKDMGTIDPAKTVRLRFAPPLEVEGRGQQQHQQVLEFISANLDRWQDNRMGELGHAR